MLPVLVDNEWKIKAPYLVAVQKEPKVDFN